MNNLRNRKGTGRLIVATKADSGTDPAFDAYGSPHGMSVSADGTVKMTTVGGSVVSKPLLAGIEYDYRAKLIWSTGTDAITVHLHY